jgi:phosphoacetylglucosamine mutase
VLKLSTVCTPTGVKHLHHAATRFDIGVYFEANGHGTVIFSDYATELFSSTEPQSPGQKSALDSLKALTRLINQAVGDALSDMLLVEVILSYKSWGPPEWITTYTDLPSRLVKVAVADRGMFKTVDAERKLVSPEGIQDKIDDVQARYHKARAFARASGTEDAVRVYAEAATKPETEDLAKRVADLVKEFGGSK